MLNLGPCSMLPPHYHPRASNYVVAVQGTTNTYMITENGARVVQETLTPGKMTIFPQASMHMMYNTGKQALLCTSATQLVIVTQPLALDSDQCHVRAASCACICMHASPRHPSLHISAVIWRPHRPFSHRPCIYLSKLPY